MPFSPEEDNVLKYFVKGILLIVRKRIVLDAYIFIINFFFSYYPNALISTSGSEGCVSHVKRTWISRSMSPSVGPQFFSVVLCFHDNVHVAVLHSRESGVYHTCFRFGGEQIAWRSTKVFVFTVSVIFLTARTLTSSSVSYLRGHFGFVYLKKGLNVDEDLSF